MPSDAPLPACRANDGTSRLKKLFLEYTNVLWMAREEEGSRLLSEVGCDGLWEERERFRKSSSTSAYASPPLCSHGKWVPPLGPLYAEPVEPARRTALGLGLVISANSERARRRRDLRGGRTQAPLGPRVMTGS